MTALSIIHNDFSIRLRYFKGFAANGNMKWGKRKNITPHQLSRIFSEEKVNWWYEKALNQNKPFTAVKKECFKVTFSIRHKDRTGARKA